MEFRIDLGFGIGGPEFGGTGPSESDPGDSGVLTLEILPFDLFNQCRPVEMQELSRLVLDPTGFIEGLKDQLLFKIADGRF